MAVTVTRIDDARLDAALDSLLPSEPYLDYARFRPITERTGALHRLHRARWHAAGVDALLASGPDGAPIALLAVAARPFESAHFGLPMVRWDPPVARPDEPLRLHALRALYRHAEAIARRDGTAHVAGAAATQDRCACWALQEIGARFVGTKITWLAPLTGAPRTAPLPAGIRLAAYDRRTIPTISAAAWARLAEWGRRGFDRGPFVFDLSVPTVDSAALYEVWTRKALTGEWAEVLLCAHRGDEIVAFNAMQRCPELSEAVGEVVLGRGIGATLPGHPGLFTALQQECAAIRPLDAAYLENETQASTIPSIQVFGKLGHRCVRSVTSFHKRLDGRDAAPA